MKSTLDQAVERFLCWKLPADFSPDCGISFQRESNYLGSGRIQYEPTGTNLLDAQQAKAMLEHVTEPMQAEINELRAALNGAELFEQSFLYQKGKIERLQAELAALKAQNKQDGLDAAMMAQDYCRSLWGAARGRPTWREAHNGFIAGYLAAGAQAQAQPVQQGPVGLQHVHDAITDDPSLCDPAHVAEVDRSAPGCIAWIGLPKLKNGAKLYAVPVQAQEQRKPLPIERLREIERLHVYSQTATLVDFARAVEQAHDIKEQP